MRRGVGSASSPHSNVLFGQAVWYFRAACEAGVVLAGAVALYAAGPRLPRLMYGVVRGSPLGVEGDFSACGTISGSGEGLTLRTEDRTLFRTLFWFSHGALHVGEMSTFQTFFHPGGPVPTRGPEVPRERAHGAADERGPGGQLARRARRRGPPRERRRRGPNTAETRAT